MDFETIKMLVLTISESTIGSLLIGIIAYFISKHRKEVKISVNETKKAKLTSDDMKEIASYVVNAQKGGLEIDVAAEMEKATQKQISAITKTQNALLEDYAQMKNIMVELAGAVGSFKTLQGTEYAKKLTAIAQQEPAKIETIEAPKQATLNVDPEAISIKAPEISEKY